MLGRVYFYLEQNTVREAEALMRDLRAHGVGVMTAPYTEESGEPWRTESCEAVRGAAAAGEAAGPAEEPEDALYITDDEEIYRVLQGQGFYVLPCRHAGNREADFAGAPYVIEQIEELGCGEIDMAYRRLAGLPWEILTTKRCIVRETTEEDADSFYRIYAEPEITGYMENLYADREEELAYLREYREKVYAFYGYGMWTVLLKDGTVIGRAGISWREGYDVPELGFVIGVPWQRQGYAYEVCTAILGYAAGELGMTQVQALVMKGNEKSLALCIKLGFRETGEVRDGGCDYVRLVRHAPQKGGTAAAGQVELQNFDKISK